MSDAVAVALVGGAVTLVLGYMQRRTQLELREHGKTIERIEHNTNGMQKTIEKLAFKAGEDKEREREKP